MNDQPGICPKCQGPLIPLQGGLVCCRSCGFSGDQPKPDPKGWSARIFWIALLSPAILALLSFVLGRVSTDLGAAIGLGSALVALISSLFCARWLAVRFHKPGIGRLFANLGLVIAIGIINLFIVFAGCVSNVNFH